VPTGLRITRKGNAFDYVFTGFETAHLTIGHKMITGVQEEVDFGGDGRSGGTSVACDYGAALPKEIPAFNPGYSPNAVPVECRVIIFETDQPPGYHVEPTQGKYYQVLWARTLKPTFAATP
jgi:hypothetical protein